MNMDPREFFCLASPWFIYCMFTLGLEPFVIIKY